MDIGGLMTKQEILKAIEKGESVWACDDFLHRVIPYKANEIAITGINTNMPAYELKDLFATKQQAEHYLHHANITRTEQLPFLTWEEFDKGNRLIRFIGKNGEKCKLEGYQKDDKQSGFIDVVVNGTGSHIDYDYTEANFYKAYDECVRLFKGEE